jgi:hypothetical protein
VHLFVRSLNEAFETGNLQTVRERLYEIPDDLDSLFISILTRDQKSLGDMLFCLELVLFSPRPLSSEEAYFAMMFHKCGLDRRDVHLHTDAMLASYIVKCRQRDCRGLKVQGASCSFHPRVSTRFPSPTPRF